MDASSNELWSQIKSNLKSKNSSNKLLQTWLEPTELIGVLDSERGRKFQLSVPNELHKYWISQNLLDRICSEIANRHGGPFEVELLVTNQQIQVEPENPGALQQALAQSEPQISAPAAAEDKNVRGSYLRPDYKFDTFVVGPNNEFAHAAAYRVTNDPGAQGYNPLFLFGPTGMGKTHLLHSVGNYLREKSPHLRVFCTTAERFLNDLVSGIRHKEMDKFRLRYRERCDILLIDDIHFFSRGEAVQEEFFHTLNDFLEKGRQVVVTSDKMPKDIAGLEDRIRTRLEWGLVADIQMPELETRVAILRYKIEQRRLKIPDDAVVYIAKISKRSIRELEGNLNRVKMYSELNGVEIDLELTKRVLNYHDTSSGLTVEEIQKLVCKHYGISLPDMRSVSRSKKLVLARHVAMFLIKKYLDKSLVQIGDAFGGRDHTTVINGLNKINDLHTQDAEIKKDIDELQARIHNITGV